MVLSESLDNVVLERGIPPLCVDVDVDVDAGVGVFLLGLLVEVLVPVSSDAVARPLLYPIVVREVASSSLADFLGTDGSRELPGLLVLRAGIANDDDFLGGGLLSSEALTAFLCMDLVVSSINKTLAAFLDRTVDSALRGAGSFEELGAFLTTLVADANSALTPHSKSSRSSLIFLSPSFIAFLASSRNCLSRLERPSSPMGLK